MLKYTDVNIRENNGTVDSFYITNIEQLLSLSFSDNYIRINECLLQYNMTENI